MRLSRLLLLPVATLGLAACGEDDGVSLNARPPLGGVRFINAVPDMRPFDIRMIDQIEWSASSVNSPTTTGLPFRAGTIHWSTEAKARRIRVFPTSDTLAIASRVLLDTTITVEANKNVTLMLVAGARAGQPNANSVTDSVRFITIVDDVPALTGNQIATRIVNGGIAPGVAVYATDTTTSAISGSPTWTAGAGFGTVSPWVIRGTTQFAGRAATTDAPNTIITSQLAPAGAPQDGLIAALAGFRAPGTAMSGYVFPRACPTVSGSLTAVNCPTALGASSAQRTAYASPGMVWFIDRIPAPPVQTSAP